MLEKNKIKIFNGSILEFKKKINQYCFVVGLEVLDNLPHDRLYVGKDGKIREQAVVEIRHDEKSGQEIMVERREAIKDELS